MSSTSQPEDRIRLSWQPIAFVPILATVVVRDRAGNACLAVRPSSDEPLKCLAGTMPAEPVEWAWPP